MRVLEALQDVQVQRVKGLTREEARGLMEFWARSGILRETVSEGLVGETWTLAGGGVVAEVEKLTKRIRVNDFSNSGPKIKRRRKF